MTIVVAESLSLINQELLVTLAEARSILESYIDSDGGAADLSVCADALHSAKGALQIAEANGAALLAEEMELTCRLLVDNQQTAPTDQGIEALTRAIVQLPAYVETIMVGGRDIPLVLLPLLNDLRAARSKPLLSESTLLLLDAGVSREDVATLIAPAPNGEDIKNLAKSLRTRFQLGLLGWIKGGVSGNELESMHHVASALEQAASTPDVHQLWWVVGGVIDALRDGGLDTSVAIKRLMGQADREIKRLASQGEQAYSSEPPAELLNNLLYYVARATTQSGRVSRIREAYNLIDLIPGDDQVEQLRQMLAAPSANLMRTVADAIRQDLTNAKDVLDIYVRTGMESVTELEPQVDMLRKISDTLGVLGLARLREAVAAHSDELRDIVQAGVAPEEARLVDLAAALLSVEDALDAELIALVEPSPAGGETEFDVVDSDYQKVTQAVMRECVVNISRIKDAISGVMGQTDDRADINELEDLLSGIKAGLAMLGNDRALATLDKAGEHILRFVRLGVGHLPLENLNRLADAIVSLEYYLETIQNGRKEPLYMLDNADRCLEAMAEAALTTAASDINVGGHEATMKVEVGDTFAASTDKTQVLRVPPSFELTAILEPPVDRTEVPAAPGGIAAAFDQQAVQIPTVKSGVETQSINQMAAAENIAIAKSFQVSDYAVLRTGDNVPDPELLEVFLEEAKQCVETIQREFPRWQADTSAHEVLATVRRSYHTLKGSGRMVGAELIGQYAWSVENLLNRIINNTLEPAPEVVELLRQAVAITPELIEQLEVGVTPSANLAILISNAHGYADRGLSYAPQPLAQNLREREDMGDLLAPDLLIPEESPDREETMAGIDPVLLDILRKESATHLGTLRDYVAESRCSAPPFAVNKDVYLAAHTLQGSLMMAEATPAIPLAEALNQLVQHAEEHRALLGSDAIDAIADAADFLQQVIAGIDQPGIGNAEEIAAVVVRLQSLRKQPPAAPVIPFDPEIAEIFAEEAAEILDSADGSLNRLSSNISDRTPLSELQRDLHTLKGGARMAGIVPMGDFSHEIEEFIDLYAGGSRAITPDAVGFLQRSFDELNRMREEVSAGRVVLPDTLLASSLQDLIARSDLMPVNPVNYTDHLSEDMTVPKAALIPPVPDPKPEPEPEVEPELAADAESAAEIPVRDFVDKLGQLARDFKAPAVPSETDIVAALGIAASPNLADLLPSDNAEPVAEVPAEVPAEPNLTQELEPAIELASEDQTAGEEIVAEDPSALLETGELAAEPAAREMAATSKDFVRVDSAVLEEMLNSAGEISIFHSRLNQQLGSIQFNLEELGATVTRLRGQLRTMDIETEAQILNRYKTQTADDEEFDPLEMDRFSTIQQLSRALAESSSDVSSIKDLLQNLARETESLLVQEARTVAELQDNLMRTRMVPFQQHVPRLARLVRQTASDENKKVSFLVEGGSGELDRQVLEKMLPPFEHMLRNAVVHGIELPEERLRLNKPETGQIRISVRRDGSEVIIEVSDDGAGLNVGEIRNRASRQADLSDTQVISDEAAMRLILKAGVTTAKQLTQSAGRGVGMDVVVNEVAKLGGTLGINSQPGTGCTFTIRLPYTLAVAQALIVQLANETYALPIPSIGGIIRVSREEFDGYLAKPTPVIDYGGVTYTFRHLGQYLGMKDLGMPQDTESVSLILVKTEEEAVALITDKTVDSREIVVKPLGAQLATVRGVSGATILGDGRIVIILDVAVLVRSMPMGDTMTLLVSDSVSGRVPLAMVVDDSITMRRVSQRLLERRGLRVVTASDGVDALEKLEYEIPDIVLLDIEMPRMDGYEFAKHLRNNPDTEKVPIIMITSRSGEKHRARAIELGVNDYLGKPYQEHEMLESVRSLLADKAPASL